MFLKCQNAGIFFFYIKLTRNRVDKIAKMPNFDYDS